MPSFERAKYLPFLHYEVITANTRTTGIEDMTSTRKLDDVIFLCHWPKESVARAEFLAFSRIHDLVGLYVFSGRATLSKVFDGKKVFLPIAGKRPRK